MNALLKRCKCWILAGAFLCLTGLAQANGLNNYIVGGLVVPDNSTEYPFMVSVYFDFTGDTMFEPGCGGTLIAERWVLTAAHCLYNNDFNRPISIERVAVFAGEKDLTASQRGSFIKAKTLIVHPDYEEQTNKYDIGLIELEEPFIAPLAALPSVDSSVPVLGEPGVVLGWGVIEESGTQSTKLREVSLPVISNAACFPFYSKQFDSRLAFCAGGSRAGGLDACQGDSGGPLLVRRMSSTGDVVYVVAGVVSYGDGCARRGIPGVYTRVEAFADWVSNLTTGTVEYIDQQGAQSVDDTQITQLALNTSITGQLLSGQVAYFDVTGAKQVNLTSTAGDADLFIIDDADFQDISADLVRCSSQNETAIDICTIDDEQLNAYAVVYGYRDANFTISSQLVTASANTAVPLESGTPLLTGSSDSEGGAISKVFLLVFLFVFALRVRLHRHK